MILIEITPPYLRVRSNEQRANPNIRNACIHAMINHMPKIEFRTPSQYLYSLKNESQLLRDDLFTKIYTNEQYQRCGYYLKLIKDSRAKEQDETKVRSVLSYNNRVDQSLEVSFDPALIEREPISEKDLLELFLDIEELADPNWHEINNYTGFLNSQLKLAENSSFFRNIIGMKTICLKLIVVMASDFGMPSLNIFDVDDPDANNMDLDNDHRFK